MPFLAPRVREDLEYFEQVIDGDEMTVIRDPIRGQYLNFNALQAAMLRSLDGRKSAAEIASALSVQFDVEIPPDAAERFIVRARELMLLDITSYSATTAAASKQVRKSLKKAGFQFRTLASTQPRQLTPESTLFSEALRQLEFGYPRAAAGYLAQILEHNPGNKRAKELYELVLTGYIKASATATDFPTYVLFNPSRLLAWLSRTVGSFLFSWRGGLLMLVWLCVGIYSYTYVAFDKITLGPGDIALTMVFTTLSNLVHECGHGFACRQYGGNVTEIGITMFYYIRPIPYCDTTSSYTIANRRHKVIVQLAGMGASFMYMSTLTVVLALLRPDFPIYSALALNLILDGPILLFDLIPLMKLDGYYAICDYLSFPNMRDRAFKVTKAWLSQLLLGVEIKTEPLPTRTRMWLMAYSIAAFVFTAWFIYMIYSAVFTRVVERFQLEGLILFVLISAYLMRNVMFRPVWDGFRMLVRERRRIFSGKRGLLFVLALAVAIGPWFLQWPVLVDDGFVIVPQTRVEIRAQVAGRIEKIAVHEGEHVTRGQELVTLRSPTLDARAEALNAALEAATLRVTELYAGARTEEFTLARARAEHAQAEVSRSAGKASAARRLAASQLGTESSADLASEQVAVDMGSAGAASAAFSLVKAGARHEDITIAEAERGRIESELDRVHEDQELLVLRSPIDGVVVTPHLEDKLEMILAPGDLFAEVHDTRTVVAEIPLSRSDPLGEIQPGDEVVLRETAAPREEIHVRIDRVREVVEAREGDQHLVAVTSPFTLSHPVSGLGGHARIYGQERSLAYSMLYLPFQRLVRVKLWSL